MVRAKTLGHLARVFVGHGQRVENPQKLWSSFKQEVKSAFMDNNEPGVVNVDADLTAGYLYAQVGMLWDLGDYLTGQWTVDMKKLASHIYCCQVSLKKYLDGRLGAA